MAPLIAPPPIASTPSLPTTSSPVTQSTSMNKQRNSKKRQRFNYREAYLSLNRKYSALLKKVNLTSKIIKKQVGEFGMSVYG